MRRLLVAACALLLAAAPAGCTSDSDAPQLTGGGGAGPSRVVVDSPELEAIKADAGVEACTPGPGGGGLPELTLPCLGGGTAVDLSTLRGPMVLSFWASWCTQCEVEMPALQEFFEAHGAEVPILGVDWQDSYPGSALEQVRDRQVTFPSLADPGGDTAGTRELARVGRGLPYLVFVDADGEVAYEQSGGVDSADDVAALVTEHLGVDL